MKITQEQKKIAATAGIGISAWSALASTWSSMPALPEIISKPIVAGISPLLIAGALAAYGVIMIWSDY